MQIILLFLISICAGLGSAHLQQSFAGTEDIQVQQDSNVSEGSDEQQPQQQQETPATNSEESPNLTSTSPDPEAVTTSPSDLISDNQTSNQTEETSKPRMFERQLSPDVLKDLSILTSPPPYKVRVVFDSMTVHNSHEGTFSGDGEYDIVAYVQGKKVGLTDASGPGDGLWDVSSGETVTFKPGTEATVSISSNLPLSIMTVGSEVDGCDRTAFPEDIQDGILRVLTLGGALKSIQDEINSGINWIGCKLNGNDVLGVISKIYQPTDYGAGSHAEKSDKGDFSLRYTVSVTAPPTPENNQQSGLQTNKFSSSLDNQLTLQQPNSSSDILTK
jgi:hypothetical protein